MDLRGLDERSGFGAPGYVRWLREQEAHEAETAVRAFSSRCRSHPADEPDNYQNDNNGSEQS